jgi:hypothetical protein
LTNPADLYRPIDANSYLREIADGKFVLDHVVGLKSDGSACFIVREVVNKKKGLKTVPTLGAYKGYNVTDLIAASGSILIANTGYTPLTAGSVLGTDTISFVKPAILKSIWIITDGTVANRQLKLGGQLISSKIVTANQKADLLDREIAVPTGVVVSVSGAAAGDGWAYTALVFTS